jgi:hypothetical protein
MKKVKKLSGQELEAVLATPLTKIRIRKLQIWAERPDFQDSTKLRPRTVGDFIEMFLYEVPAGRRMRQLESLRLLDGLGSKTVRLIKRKFLRLGITPDIWPALINKKDFFTVLPKDVIVSIPVGVIFDRCHPAAMKRYLKCRTDEDLACKTMKDFFKVDPRANTRFLSSRKRNLARIRLVLGKRGFTRSDGAFFKWNPQARSLKKAMSIFKGKGLSNSLLRIVAGVAVDRGLV